MSYILDALRKSDQQRQRGATPTLLTVQATATDPRRPRYLINSTLAAVLICAGILVGWLRPWQMKHPTPAAEPIAPMPIAFSPHLAVPASPSGSPELIGESQHEPPLRQSTSATPPGGLAAPATRPVTPEPADNASFSPLPRHDTGVREATRMPVQDAAVPTGTAAEGGRRIMALNELPPPIQREIPEISIAFHAYSSNPKERRVMINGDMAEQGEQLAPGLNLEQITPDGVILAYKGFRFHQGVR